MNDCNNRRFAPHCLDQLRQVVLLMQPSASHLCDPSSPPRSLPHFSHPPSLLPSSRVLVPRFCCVSVSLISSLSRTLCVLCHLSFSFSFIPPSPITCPSCFPFPRASMSSPSAATPARSLPSLGTHFVTRSLLLPASERHIRPSAPPSAALPHLAP